MDKQFLEKVLLKCALMGIGCLLFWFAAIVVAGDWAFQIHSQIFEITRRDFDQINYYGMAALKLSVFLLFVIPWIALRLTPAAKE
jgi:hypothetical protein